jgi:hypothetical protein
MEEKTPLKKEFMSFFRKLKFFLLKSAFFFLKSSLFFFGVGPSPWKRVQQQEKQRRLKPGSGHPFRNSCYFPPKRKITAVSKEVLPDRHSAEVKP